MNDGALSGLERDLLRTLLERNECGDTLTGLRCGLSVCEALTVLADRDLLQLTRMEQDGDALIVDIDLKEETNSWPP